METVKFKPNMTNKSIPSIKVSVKTCYLYTSITEATKGKASRMIEVINK